MSKFDRREQTRRSRTWAVLACAGLVMSVALVAAPARATQSAPTCAGPADGGSWPSYGHDLSNTRNQDLEDTISAAKAPFLAAHKLWSSTTGAIESTPVVADGCLFAGTSGGQVVALNADTLEVVWQAQVALPTTPSGYGGLIVGSPVVDSGKVIVAVDTYASPSVVALDEATGTPLWHTVVESPDDGDWGNVAGENASPSVANGRVFLGFYGSEDHPNARGGYVILDEATGQRLHHEYTITDAEWNDGYRGASIWTTAAIADGFAYVGTGNPGGTDTQGKTAGCRQWTVPGETCQAALESTWSNSILKIDLSSGAIVGSYHANPDNYVDGAYDQPACANAGEVEVSTSPPAGAWSIPCGQLDLDFGASPNLLNGGSVVGDLQKSGVYHAVNTADMTKAFATPVGAPCAACNAASTAADGAGIYGESTPGGTMISLSTSGLYRWATPVGDGVHYESTSIANGVVYSTDTTGNLDAFDAATGAPLLHRPISLDVGNSVSDLSSSGVAIARHTVYVAYGGYVLAYGV